MYHIMKTASVRDLRYDFPKVERMLRQGEEVQITKRKKVIARLVPEQKTEKPDWPDFIGRMQKIFGDKILEESGADIVCWDRNRN